MKNNKPAELASSTRKRLRTVKKALPPVATRFKKAPSAPTETALQNVPRITNETVAEHRENILKGGRKYKYPLEHSKRRIVMVSTTLLGLALIGFIVYIGLSLYRWQSNSLFMYRVTQILPLPVAKTENRWISYESYLFELRRYMHYYETQQKVDFTSETGKLQLATYKPKAMAQVVSQAYIKELAQKNNIRVTDKEVNDAITMLKTQNQLGSSDTELASVANKFFGWSLNDLRREIRQELLAQNLAAALDKTSYAEAQNVLVQLRAGADFAALAAQASDDTATKTNGGQYNDTAITSLSQEVPPAVVRALAKLKPGEVSPIVKTGEAFEIVKLLSDEGGKYKAAHIQIRFKDVRTHVDPLEKAHKPKYFIHIPAQR